MSERSGRPASGSLVALKRLLAVRALKAVVVFGRQVSKLGPVGQSIREWALKRLQRYGEIPGSDE